MRTPLHPLLLCFTITALAPILPICLAQSAPDVTSQIVNVGQANGGGNYTGVTDLIVWRGALYMPGGSNNDTTHNLPLYRSVGGFSQEIGNGTAALTVRQELINRAFVIDGELVLSGEDGNPNRASGITVGRTGGWGLRPVDEDKYDATHLSAQYKYNGLYFATYKETEGFPNSLGKSCILVSSDGLSTWTDIGDPLGQFGPYPEYPNAQHSTRSLYELGGGLYAAACISYKPEGALFNSIIPKNWMLRYTGRADHAFEVIYDRAQDFWPSLSAYGGVPQVFKTVTLRNGKALMYALDKIIRIRFETAVSATTGDSYSKPVAESEPFAANVEDLYVAHGVAYVLTINSSTNTYAVHASTDGITWSALCTFVGPIGTGFSTASGQVAVYDNQLFLGSGKQIIRIPSTVVPLPQNNATPIPQPDSFLSEGSHIIRALTYRTGLLSNDTDPDADPIEVELVAAPTNGILTLNSDGTFWYRPNAGFVGTDTFTYRAKDGRSASDPTLVTFQIGARRDFVLDNMDPEGVTFTGSWTTDAAPRANVKYFGANFRHDNNLNKGSATARFTPPLETPGIYEVLVRQPTHTHAGYNYFYDPTASATNVPVAIQHHAGIANLTLNQNAGNNTWQSLGSFYFLAGNGGYVEISNTNTTAAVSVDAVRFVLRDAPSSVLASATDWRSATLSWTDNNLDETGFELQRSSDGGATWWAAGFAATDATTHRDIGLAADTLYHYRIRALRLTGPTEWSDLATVRTLPLYSVPAQGDSYIANSGATSNYGTSSTMRLETKGGPTYRKVYLQFVTPSRSELGWSAYANAKLQITPAEWPASSLTLAVWGLKNSHTADSLDGWTETGITWSNAPANNLSSATFLSADATNIGAWTVASGTTANTRLTYTSTSFDTFLNTDTNGRITMLLARSTSSSDNSTLHSRQAVPSSVVERTPWLVTPPAGPPAPPESADLQAERLDNGSYFLSWFDVPDVQGLIIQRSTDLMTWSEVASVAAHAGVFTDSTAPSGLIFYRLVSVNPNGNSAGSAPAGRTYANWRLAHFPAATTATLNQTGAAWADDTDDDGDGLPVALEYALGTSPTVRDQNAWSSQMRPDGTALRLSFQEALHSTDFKLRAEWSENLQSWDDTGLVWEILGESAGSRSIQVDIPMVGRSRVFVRLRVSEL